MMHDTGHSLFCLIYVKCVLAFLHHKIQGLSRRLVPFSCLLRSDVGRDNFSRWDDYDWSTWRRLYRSYVFHNFRLVGDLTRKQKDEASKIITPLRYDWSLPLMLVFGWTLWEDCHPMGCTNSTEAGVDSNPPRSSASQPSQGNITNNTTSGSVGK
jgi:hypothetical protein